MIHRGEHHHVPAPMDWAMFPMSASPVQYSAMRKRDSIGTDGSVPTLPRYFYAFALCFKMERCTNKAMTAIMISVAH